VVYRLPPARPLSARELTLLQQLFDATPVGGGWTDARRFRADHHAEIALIQGMEDDAFIRKERDAYRLSLTAVVHLDGERAQHVLQCCEAMLTILRDWYITHLSDALSVPQLAEQIGCEQEMALEALHYLLESPGWYSGHSLSSAGSTPAVWLAEGVLLGHELGGRIKQLVEWQIQKIKSNRPYAGRAVSLSSEIDGRSEFEEPYLQGFGKITSFRGSSMARLFFSYSHDDELHRDQLEKHFAALKHEGLIESWHDRRILAGANLDAAIDQHLEQADVVLLLVSASFIASRYCYGIEMTRALQRQSRGEVKVVPVIVRPCDWQNTPLGQLMAAPRDGKAITTWSNIDEAYADVARQLRSVVEALGSADHQLAVPLAVPVGMNVQPAGLSSPPRSSNLRLKKEFTEADKDDYLQQAFDFMARFFEGSLQELQQRHPDVDCRFQHCSGLVPVDILLKERPDRRFPNLARLQVLQLELVGEHAVDLVRNILQDQHVFRFERLDGVHGYTPRLASAAAMV